MGQIYVGLVIVLLVVSVVEFYDYNGRDISTSRITHLEMSSLWPLNIMQSLEKQIYPKWTPISDI